MSAVPWFDGGTGQSTAELVALHGRYRTDSIVLAVERALLDRRARGDVALTEEERVVLAVEALERDVNSGGFDLFCAVDAAKEVAPAVVSALERIGCHETAAVVRDAIDAAARHDARARDELLEGCEQRYHGTTENIEEAVFAFIVRHQASISTTGRAISRDAR